MTHLVKRGRPVEREVIGAILGIRPAVSEQLLPDKIEVQGPQAWADLGKVLPYSLCKKLLQQQELVKIKIEP